MEDHTRRPDGPHAFRQNLKPRATDFLQGFRHLGLEPGVCEPKRNIPKGSFLRNGKEQLPALT